MKNLSTLLLIVLVFACQPKKKEDNDLVTGGNDSGSTTGSSGGGGTSSSYGIIFMTTTKVDGGYAYTGTVPTYMTKFDDLCASQATAKNLSGVYKALMANHSERHACTTTNCSGGASENHKWVLRANTEYRREDGVTVIGTTNAAAIFEFPLTNSMVDASVDTPVWTGIRDGWVRPVAPFNGTCESWGNNVSGEGFVGDASLTTAEAINKNMYMERQCNSQNSILCAKLVPVVTTLTAQGSSRKIFVSTTTLVGGAANSAVTRFDNICQTDANTLGIGHDGRTKYKAMFYQGSTSNGATQRLPCLTGFCGNGAGEAVNWVLEANRQYVRTNGTVIGTTDANRLLPFPLTNAISATSQTIWTGMTETWARSTIDNQNNCQFFQSNSASDVSYTGDAGSTTETAIYSGTTACDQAARLVCVEQTRSQDVFTEYPDYSL